MRNRLYRSILLVVILCLSQLCMADVYKFTDEEGVVHYTNVKPVGRQDVRRFTFPCYASDPKCQQLDWELIPLNRKAFVSEIRAAAQVFGVDPALIRAIIQAESAYQPGARSPRGAQGLMQLMPATQKVLQIDDVFDPASNIEGGTRYLASLLDEFGQNIEMATAAYNAGPGAVHEFGGVPPYPETREYVRRIRILYRRYRDPNS